MCTRGDVDETGTAKTPGRQHVDNTLIFIVGKGRSGTTLVGRVLQQHPEVALLPELDFFERLWPSVAGRKLARAEAVAFVVRLLQRARWYPKRRDPMSDPMTLWAEAADLVSRLKDRAPRALFSAVLSYEARSRGKRIACDQTARNVFYLRNVLELFPDARVVVVVRDPRGVFAAQKDRWRVTSIGSYVVPASERRRRRMNSHPVAITMQWRAAVRAAKRYARHERVFVLRFEDLVELPHITIRRLCDFLGLVFEEPMLNVSHIGANFEVTGRKGLDPSEAGRWREVLSPTEIFLCERVAGRVMRRLGYKPTDVPPQPLALVRTAVAFPLQAAAVMALNRRYHRQFVGWLRH